MNWLIEKVLKVYLTKWFNALTLSGKKRILGVIIFALATAVKEWPDLAGNIQQLIQFLMTLGPDQYQEVGVVTFVVGLLHWLIKKYFGALPADLPQSPVTKLSLSKW